MQTVCEATQVKDDDNLVEAALQCIVAIIDLYYPYMEKYIKSLFVVRFYIYLIKKKFFIFVG
jgi:hypothetical protein